jgi:hypothetical protein
MSIDVLRFLRSKINLHSGACLGQAGIITEGVSRGTEQVKDLHLGKKKLCVPAFKKLT